MNQTKIMKQSKLQTLYDKACNSAFRAKLIVTSAILTMPTNVYANGAAAAGGGKDQALNLMINLLGQIIGLFPAIGIVIAAIGAFKLFMAFRNDQPDAYSGAAKDIVIGIVLIIFDTFIWPTIQGLVGKGGTATS